MARYTGAKCRLCRREGQKLFLKGERCFLNCPIDKKGAAPPGVHGRRGFRRMSSYGEQLREKQKVKRSYGIGERQLRGYFEEAKKTRGATAELLLRSLEIRLDNVLYRLGFALSRSVARQLVNHGHVSVNGKRVDIPSYRVKVGDTISFNSKSFGIIIVKKSMEADSLSTKWLERKGGVGKMVRMPTREDIDIGINENLVVEYYSR